MNVTNAFTKFNKLDFYLLIRLIEVTINESWLSEIRDGSNLNLTTYNIFNQIGKCPGHSHCGIIMKCESFALTHDILFNASKTKYMIFKRCESVNTAPLYFKNMPINCVHECDLLGITLSSSRTTANSYRKGSHEI